MLLLPKQPLMVSLKRCDTCQGPCWTSQGRGWLQLSSAWGTHPPGGESSGRKGQLVPVCLMPRGLSVCLLVSQARWGVRLQRVAVQASSPVAHTKHTGWGKQSKEADWCQRL